MSIQPITRVISINSGSLKKALMAGAEKNKKILAYDGTYATDFNYHSIDSIVQDAKKVAKESVNMLIKLINDQPLKKREVLVPVKYKKGDTL